MNIDETKEIVIRWVKSCDTAEQVLILSKAIPQFFKPFKRENLDMSKKEDLDYHLKYECTLVDIRDAIDIQKLLVARVQYTGIPTLDCYASRN